MNFDKKRLANQRAYYERTREAQNAANMVRYYANPEYKELKNQRAREAYREKTKDMPRMKRGRKPKTNQFDRDDYERSSEEIPIQERLSAHPKAVGRPRIQLE